MSEAQKFASAQSADEVLGVNERTHRPSARDVKVMRLLAWRLWVGFCLVALVLAVIGDQGSVRTVALIGLSLWVTGKRP